MLRDTIFKNQILPGQRIYLENLSEQLKISQTPLREALNRLVQEGLFSHDSNRGYTLRVIQNSDVEKFYEFCEAIETYAIARAIDNVTELDLKELKENLSRYKLSIDENYSRERFLINNEFHLKVAALSTNSIIVENLKQLLEKLVWKWKLENIAHGRGPEAYSEHLAIYGALEKRDTQAAVNDLRLHIINTKISVMKMLSMRENLFSER